MLKLYFEVTDWLLTEKKKIKHSGIKYLLNLDTSLFILTKWEITFSFRTKRDQPANTSSKSSFYGVNKIPFKENKISEYFLLNNENILPKVLSFHT